MTVSAPEQAPSSERRVPLTPDDRNEVMAKVALLPSANAAAVMERYTTRFGQQNFVALGNALKVETENLCASDMKQVKAMLYAQAQALQSIFMNLALRASDQTQMKHWESFLRLALKAQNQCRMTLETLATVEHPPVVFARQANINTGGQQQVNNVAPAASAAHVSAHATKSGTEKTELLEASDGKRLDARAESATRSADPHLATVGEVDRTSQRCG